MAVAIARFGVAPLRDVVGQLRRLIAVLLIGADFVTISTFTVALAPLVESVFGDALWRLFTI